MSDFLLIFLCRRDNLLVEEIVDYNRRIVERAFDEIIVPDIQQTFLLAKLMHLSIQHRPVATVFLS